MDVVSIVSYILGQNPQPFIFEAADINNDSSVNVLDIVGVINIILGRNNAQSSAIAQKSNSFDAKIDLIEDQLVLNTSIPVAALQIKLEDKQINDLEFLPSEAFSKFEFAHGKPNDSTKIFLAYNLNGTVIPAGTHILGKFKGINRQTKITDVVLADQNGKSISVKVYNNGEPLIPDKYYLHQNFPNPFNARTIIQFGVPEDVKDLKIEVYNILGQRIKTFNLGELKPGRYQVEWDGRNDYGIGVASGVYIYQLRTKNFVNAKKMLLLK